MRVVIIGAGEVGFHIAKSLSELDYDIAVVDINSMKCQRANEHLDVIVIKGNGSDAKILKEANVSEADYVFCMTNSDETNLIASMQSHTLGAKKIVARLRNTDYRNNGDGSISPEKFGIDEVIHPEYEVAKEIVRLVKHPYADKFQYSNIYDPDIYTTEGLPSNYGVGTRESNLQSNFDTGVSIEFWLKVMIAGASKIGRKIARELEDSMSVRLVDSSEEKAKTVASELGESIVMNADATDVEFLKNENISEVDSFIAVTEDEQLNLLAGILAKQLKVKQSVIHVSNPDYVKSMSDLGLGAIVSKNTSSVNSIVKAIRIDQKDNVIQIFSRLGMEAIELEVENNSKASRVPVANLNLPHGSLIALVNHNGHIAIPSGDYQILPNDTVLIFCINSKVKEVTSIFKPE